MFLRSASLLLLSMFITHQARAFVVKINGVEAPVAQSGQYHIDKIEHKPSVPVTPLNKVGLTTNIDPHRFDIVMSRPVTKQEDVNAQLEQTCISIGLQNPKRTLAESEIRAKCHSLNERPAPQLPSFKPLLKYSRDNLDVPKGYKPHFKIGEIKITDSSDIQKSDLPKPTTNTLIKNTPLKDIEESGFKDSEFTGLKDRDCDLTRNLRVMLSPKCLNHSEKLAHDHIGSGDYGPIFQQKESSNQAISSSSVSNQQDSDNPLYLCHVVFDRRMRRGFVQGYTKTIDECVQAGKSIAGVKYITVFDHLGYIVRKVRGYVL